MATPQQQKLYEEFYRHRTQKTGAITPGQQLALITTLRNETIADGKIPVASNKVVQLAPNDQGLVAAINGELVSSGGQAITSNNLLGGVLSPARVLVMIALVVGAIAAILLSVFWPFGSSKANKTEPTAVEITVIPTLLPTALPTLSPPPPPPTEPPPTPTPVVIQAPLVAAEGQNDPASVEVGGQVFVLSRGTVKDGVWQPGARDGSSGEWLDNTIMRRVIGLPYNDATQRIMSSMKSGDVIRVRLRSGEIVDYVAFTISRVRQEQIELINGRDPSVALFLYGEASSERWVAIGALNNKDESRFFTDYTPTLEAVSGLSVSGVSAATLPLITAAQAVNGQGMLLTVSQCRQQDSLFGQPAPASGEAYVVCVIAFSATRDGGLSYDGADVIIANQSRFAADARNWPPPISVNGMVASGALNRNGESVTGQAAGLVKTGEAVSLGWRYGGKQYFIKLTVS